VPSCYPQAFGAVRKMRSDGLHTCALGAALEAVRARPGYDPADELWPALAKLEQLQCPVCHCTGLDVFVAVVHLNDGHHWTRERIADWVESVESGLARSAAEPAGGLSAGEWGVPRGRADVLGSLQRTGR
jgi:hypothetical protein